MLKPLFIVIMTSLLFNHAVHAETLLELYQLAEKNDPSLKVTSSERLITKEKKTQTQSTLMPQVNVGAEMRQQWHDDDWLLFNDSERTSASYNVSLRYPLFRENVALAVKQADSYIDKAEAVYESERQSLMEKVATRYFDVLSANDNLSFVRSAKKSFQKQFERSKARLEVGFGVITEVKESQAAYELAIADELQAENSLNTTIESLRELTGEYHHTLASLSPKLPLEEPKPNDMDKWTEIAFKNNPLLAAVHQDVIAARQEIGKQRATNKLPTVDLVAEHSYTDTIRGDDVFGGGTNNSIAVQLNYSFFEGGAKKSYLREAQERYTQTLDKLELQKRIVQLQTHNAYLNVMSNISRVKALKQAMLSTETALEAVQEEIKVGTRIINDFLDARRDLLQAQRNYAAARYDYVLNILRLKQAAGLLDKEALETVNAWLVAANAAETTTSEKSEKSHSEESKKSNSDSDDSDTTEKNEKETVETE